jgi:regulator of protease activity HflC (stomatin/prohibitin superfamily)
VKIPFVNNVRKFDGRMLTLDSQPERFFTQEQKALIIDSYAKYRIADTASFTPRRTARSRARRGFCRSVSTTGCATRWPSARSRRWCPVSATS